MTTSRERFARLTNTLAKGRVTPLFRVTATPPAEDGTMHFRPNPQRGATYFANTQHGAYEAAQTPNDEEGRSVASTVIRRQTHRIYGHNLPLLEREDRVQAKLSHFARIADRAPHPEVASVIKHLSRYVADRPHTVVTDKHGQKWRQYQDRHAPLEWSAFESQDFRAKHDGNNDAAPLQSLSEHSSYKAELDQAHPLYGRLKSTMQRALYHMGYHGASIKDEAGDWNRNTPKGFGRNQGSIALLPTASAHLKARSVDRVKSTPIDFAPGETTPDRLRDPVYRGYLKRRALSRKMGRQITFADQVSMDNNRSLSEPRPPVKIEPQSPVFRALTKALTKALFDMKTLSKNPAEVAQSDIDRTSFEKPSSFAKYDEAVGRTLRAWNSTANKKRLESGIRAQGHEWYHMDQLHHRFRERHGAQEGTRRFNLFMDTIAATSHNSEFGSNMRRAGAMFPFMLHGHSERRLSRQEGLNHLLGPKLGNTAHREMAEALQSVRDRRPTISKEPLKIDGFAENLRGNFRPLTADRHVGRQAGSEGKTSLSIVYRGIEDATQHHAQQLAQRGHLPVAQGRAATAGFQSALWVGDALSGRVKSKPEPALAEFEREIHTAAQKRNIRPSQALDLFMDGHLHEFGGGAPGLREHVRAPLVKAFQELFDTLEKGRVTPIFRATTTQPDAQGKSTVRSDPVRGVTYFANTEQGAAEGAMVMNSDRGEMHIYHTAVTPQHRIYGHRLPRIISEERIEARKQHVERLASAAPHPHIGHMMRNLESRLWDRSHTKITMPGGKPGRQYYNRGESSPFSGKHAPLTWQELEGEHDIDHRPSVPTYAELRASKPYDYSMLGSHRSVVQAALHRLGYHGAAVADEGGSWRGTRAGMGDKDAGSIALLPHAIGGKKVSMVREPAIPEFQRRRDEARRAQPLTKAEVEAVMKRRSRGDALQPWKMVRRRTRHPLFDPIMIVRIPYGAMRDEYNAPTSTPGYAEAMADASGDSGNV